MKTIKRICLLLIFTVLSAMPMWADDFDTIYERMYERYLKYSTPSSEQIEEILNTILPNGAISGIDYKVSNGSPRKHVQLLTLHVQLYGTKVNGEYIFPIRCVNLFQQKKSIYGYMEQIQILSLILYSLKEIKLEVV